MTSPSVFPKNYILLTGIVAGMVVISLAAALPALFIWKEFVI